MSIRSSAQEGQTQRRLFWHGAFLFLLGLLTGFAEQQLANPRMGLAAHLEGVMNGTFLLALGAAWPHVHLMPRAKTVAYWSMLYGTYVNWAMTTLAAAFGTAAMTPLTGSANGGAVWQERVVMVGFASVGIAIIVVVVMVLWGLRGAPANSPPSAGVAER